MHNYRVAVSAAILLILHTCTGCEQEVLPEGMPELHPVAITVIQDGQPLANASIRLIPDDGASRWSSGGSTDANGVAILRTHGKYEGVPVGSYRVTISKIQMPEPASADLGPLDSASGANEPTYDLVAPQFAYPNQTPLRLEVVAGDNTQEFDVGSAVKEARTGPPAP